MLVSRDENVDRMIDGDLGGSTFANGANIEEDVLFDDQYELCEVIGK